ncbi:MAG: DEAD/DEAH box helicase family protein [Mariprofundaceae bacterium]|nr:DEAD/DEAH box helicase family protein [Mariprofundaceae bacterium]
MDITKAELQKCFTASYFSRGSAYFRQNKVLNLSVELNVDQQLQFTSEVEGRYDSYTQTVTLMRVVNNKLKVKGYCSCPMDYNCKHVVAACLYCLQTLKQPKLMPDHVSCDHEQWLSNFVDTCKSPVRSNALGKQVFLVYVLMLDVETKQLTVSFHRTKYLQRGGLSKGKSLSYYEFSSSIKYYIPNYLTTVDVEIIQLLEVGAGEFTNTCIVKGHAGGVALQKMLQEERCYWANHQGELIRYTEPREFSCTWQNNEQGGAKLAMHITPTAKLLLVEPAMYWDEANMSMGLLSNVPYNSEQLTMLLEAPVIPAAALDVFSMRIAQSIPKRLLAPPKELETELIQGEQPVPHLLLECQSYQGHNYRVARLRFVYAAYEFSGMSQELESIQVIDGKVVTVERDLEEENSYLGAVEMLGFEPLETPEDEDFYLYFQADHGFEEDAFWLRFMDEVLPEMQEDGWFIEISDQFNMQLHEVDQWHAGIEETGNDWFDLSFDVEVGGQKLALLPLIIQVLEYYDPEDLPEVLPLNLGDGKYLKVLSEQIKPMLDILYELYDGETLSDQGSLKMSRFDVGRLTDLEQEQHYLQWQGGEALRRIGRELKDFNGITAVAAPQGLQAELRHYQQQGLNWLQFLRHYHFHGILADDMGLGKTVQTLAHILLEKEQGRLTQPCLIIAPTSLMSNWRHEAAQFAPALKVLVLQGAERHQHFDDIAAYDIVLSTYPLLVRDEQVLLVHEYHLLVLDEAQVVKNPKSKAAQVIRKFHASHKLCLTGTPMENHLGELWALFDFLMPGFLGNMKQFNRVFRVPIEKHGSSELQQRLVHRITPFMLRRLKKDVVQELPDKTEITRMVCLGKQQTALYESIRIAMEKKVRQTIASKGLARSHITILDALLKLRQVCCDPRILSLKQAKNIKESAKLELLMEMLPQMLEEGRRILIFSQFTKMLGLIEAEIKALNISYTKLTGQTRKREEAIDTFKTGRANVFLISLKAGGVGLNLTEADTVIHYDPWWNPAAEDQATDRAHRIGQEKAVFVYKLVVENSLEEKIIAMQQKKKALAQAVYQQGESKDKMLISAEDMKDLFAPL